MENRGMSEKWENERDSQIERYKVEAKRVRGVETVKRELL